jgi:hypothetical protein
MPAPHGVPIATRSSRYQLVEKRGRASEAIVQCDCSRPEGAVLGRRAVLPYLLLILAGELSMRVLPEERDVSGGGVFAFQKNSAREVNHERARSVKRRKGIARKVQVIKARED